MKRKPATFPVQTTGEPVRLLLLDLDQGGEADAILAGVAGEVQLVHLRFAGLTAAALIEIAPGCVIMPLFARGHDAMQVIEQLEDWGFDQAMIVLARALPRPAMVEAELRSLGPGQRLTLTVLGPAGQQSFN